MRKIFFKYFFIPIVLLMSCASLCQAGEGGTSSYLVGFNDFLSGIIPPPGFYFRNDTVSFHGHVSEVLAENFLETNASINNIANISRFTYVTPLKLLNSNWGASLRIPIINTDFTGEINSPIFIARASQSVNNLGDIVLSPFILGWHYEYFHWVLSVPTIYFPTGTYSLSRYVNTGKNRYAIQGDFNTTYFNTTNGLELSAAIGYTSNFKNHATDYLSGSELHLDALLAAHMQANLSLGLAGFFLQQITGDSGSGATLGSNKGMTIGLGPAIDFSSSIKKLKISIRSKYYHDINSINRWSGDWFWFSVLLS